MENDLHEMQLELENVQNVIHLTKENIDALNDRFSKFNPLPKIYLDEFQDLTVKLHQLKSMEQNLIDKMQAMQEPIEMESKPQTKKVLLRAHLPNQQRTLVQVIPGMRLRDALAKPLKRRNLTFDMCEVYQGDSEILIPWDSDISTLNCDEISVRHIICPGFPTYISHQYVRKTFFSLAFCECCRRLLFTGFYCSQCNYRFHQRCANKVPPLCSKLQMDTYYRMLLASDSQSYVSNR